MNAVPGGSVWYFHPQEGRTEDGADPAIWYRKKTTPGGFYNTLHWEIHEQDLQSRTTSGDNSIQDVSRK